MKKNTSFVRFIMITLGSLLYSAGLGIFLSRAGLACGGVSGLSVVLDALTGVSTGVWILLLNIPIAVLAVVRFGGRFFLASGYSVLLLSVFTDLFEKLIPQPTGDRFLCVMAGAVMMGAGIGVVLRGGATTGGTDIIVKVVRSRLRSVGTGTVTLIIDAFVVTLSAVVFRDIEVALYAALGVIVQSVVINYVLYGSDGARLVYIISDRSEAGAERIMYGLGAGVTFIRWGGGYTGSDKKILLCALRMRSLPRLRDIVRDEDGGAFMIVTKATSVFGEGFLPNSASEL